ncbi:MAG TPA: class I SAM-dependent methyltransferase [Candidatus Saccharimonadales bacterium]|nr:class I SAM-dependent methyltransferase [Candidatus Saccharimonadales bacterium]
MNLKRQRQDGKTQYSNLVEDYSRGTRQTFDSSAYKERLLDWAGLHEHEPRKILDLGCGEGTFTHFLEKDFSNGLTVIGVDNTKEMIDFARSEYPTIDFRCEDMNDLSLGDNSVDFVFSRFAVHYSDNLTETLTEIARVTKPGGRFFLKDIHPFYATFYKSSFDYEQKENATFTTQGDSGVQVTHPTFTMSEYSEAFEGAGWTLRSIHEIYGQDANGPKIQPFRVPTSVCFILDK